MKADKTLMIATAAIALMVASAPVMAETTTTTTKTTETVVDPLTATTNTTISAQTTTDGVVKETTTKVKDATTGATVGTSVTTETAPVTTRSEMQVQTQETTIAADGTRLFNISEFDINKDGVLSTPEVGEKLFGMYDTDGNGMIDNNEYEKNIVVTVTPVEKTTTITYDFNGDGIIDGSDQHRIGKNSMPRGQYGFSADLNYKGWFMNMLWQGATPADLYMGGMIQGSQSGSGYPPVIYDFQTDVWTPNNTGARYPRLRSTASYNGSNNYGSSDFWLINTGYLRLKTLSIGYDFKHKLLKRVAWMNKCNVSLNGYNLLTFSKANKFDIDPEIGDGNLYTYPDSRVYSISVNVGF